MNESFLLIKIVIVIVCIIAYVLLKKFGYHRFAQIPLMVGSFTFGYLIGDFIFQ
jgi:uncharacterized membrane protein (DUF485 family)